VKKTSVTPVCLGKESHAYLTVSSRVLDVYVVVHSVVDTRQN
jgi:hypothetical protein